MSKPWVTNTVAVCAMAMAVWGLATKQLPMPEAVDLLFYAGLAVGIGRKLDRHHDSTERLIETTRAMPTLPAGQAGGDLDALVREEQR